MMRSLLFYISGHGFGHARRMTQVIREIRGIDPTRTVHVRSAAPARIFEPLPPEFIEPCDIDSGLAETDPLTIDRENSLQRLISFMARREKIVADEILAVRRIKPDLIVADIPFLAGDVAEQTGTPCVGISNFTWDWIYENLFGSSAKTECLPPTPVLRYSEEPDSAPLDPALRSTSEPASGVMNPLLSVDECYASLAPLISDAYAKFGLLLELPFGKTCPRIAKKISMPLIAMQSRRERADILRQLGISSEDHRPRVLIGTRGSLRGDIVARIAAQAHEFLFLCPRESADSLPDNVLGFDLSPLLDFSDVTRIADVVVSKLGYGIVSEAIASQCRLVWPAREGFVEDEISAAQAPRFAPMLEMPREDYYGGNWADALRAAMNLPPARETMRTDGARACAEFLLREF